MSVVYVVIRKSIFQHDVAVKVVGVYDTKELAYEASSLLAKKSNFGHIRIDVVPRTIVKKTKEERDAKRLSRELRKPEIEKQNEERKASKERCRLAALNGEMENV